MNHKSLHTKQLKVIKTSRVGTEEVYKDDRMERESTSMLIYMKSSKILQIIENLYQYKKCRKLETYKVKSFKRLDRSSRTRWGRYGTTDYSSTYLRRRDYITRKTDLEYKPTKL